MTSTFTVKDVIKKYVRLKGVDEIFYASDYYQIMLEGDIIIVKDDFGNSFITNINEIQEVLEKKEYPEYYI